MQATNYILSCNSGCITYTCYQHAFFLFANFKLSRNEISNDCTEACICRYFSKVSIMLHNNNILPVRDFFAHQTMFSKKIGKLD